MRATAGELVTSGVRRSSRFAAAVLLACACAGCQEGRSALAPGGASVPAVAAPRFVWSGLHGVAAAPPSGEGQAYIGRYQQTVHLAAGLGLQVWVEADLAKRWRAGPQAFQAGVARLAQLAKDPHVVGFKIADELAYQDGFDRHPAAVLAFLHDARESLAAASPGRKIMVDFAVPVLGCAPGLDLGPSALKCMGDSQAKYPALSLNAMDSYVDSGDIDVLSLSTFLQDPSMYSYWGTTIQDAQEDAWNLVKRRGWSNLVTLQARKAFADPGGYDGSTADARHDLGLYVDTPLREGAESAHIWAWRQPYKDRLVSLVDNHLDPNPLWDGLVARKEAGMRQVVTFSPSQVAVDVKTDLRTIAQAFTGVIVAAGAG